MSDKELIDDLGGATVLAKRFRYSVQRVQNWKKRGIPSKVKLEHPELFLKPAQEQNSTNNP